MSSSVYAGNIKQLMINELDQFQSSSSGANVGIGYSGFDSALDYSRAEDLDYFSAIFQMGGDADDPMAFGYGMWRWSYLVRMFTRYDGKDTAECDSNVATLADEFLVMMFGTENRQAIDGGSGWAKVIAANYIGDIMHINDAVYITMEFLIVVKQQV